MPPGDLSIGDDHSARVQLEAMRRLAGIELLAALPLAVVWVVFVVREQPKGPRRFFSSLPVFVLFALAPLPYRSAVVSGALAFLLTWVANFKLLAFVADRGPMARDGLSAVQYGAFLLLPFYNVRAGRTPPTGGWNDVRSISLKIMIKVAFTAGLTLLLSSPIGHQSGFVKHAAYACYVWMFASLLLDSAVPAFSHIFNDIPLQPAMERPYLAKSVKDFWGRHFNQIISCCMYDVVYAPIMQRRWYAAKGPIADTIAQMKRQVAAACQVEGPAKDAMLRMADVAPPVKDTLVRESIQRVSALMATFVVSGTMHGICVWYMCRCVHWPGRLMAFFVLQPFLIVLEDTIKQNLPRQVLLARWFPAVQRLVTLSVLLLSAHLLFWQSLEASGVDKQGLREMMGVLHAIRSALHL